MAMSLPTGERLFFPPSDEPRTVYRCFWRAVRLLDAYDATEYLQPGMTVVDAGAHLGSFALLASQLVGDEGRVYAVEPISAEYLRRCVADNQLGNVEVCPVALADEDGELSLQLSTQSGMHSAVIGPSQRTITVPKRTLDGLVAEWGLASVDFIKVDVEGYEPQVLQGARETIARFRPVLALAAYHFPEHRQLLPQMIHDLVDDYAVHVGKACSGLELKCWGVPRERLSRPAR
jgi:FkbM family methyltransferase